MVIDQRDYERISGRRGDPNERLALAKSTLDVRKHQNADQLHRARIARRLAFRGLGGWALLTLYPRATVLIIILFIVLAIVLGQI